MKKNRGRGRAKGVSVSLIVGLLTAFAACGNANDAALNGSESGTMKTEEAVTDAEAKTASDPAWDEEVRQLLSSYRVPFEILEIKERDSEIHYSIVTKDERAIPFTVRCRYVQKTQAFGFAAAAMEKQVTDDLYEQVMAYVSTNYGQMDLSGMTLSESADAILETIEKVKEIAGEYGIQQAETYEPTVNFLLRNGPYEIHLSTRAQQRERLEKQLEALWEQAASEAEEEKE